MYIFIYFYSWCDVIHDFINSINVDVDTWLNKKKKCIIKMDCMKLYWLLQFRKFQNEKYDGNKL